MKAIRLLSGTAALLCAAVLLASGARQIRGTGSSIPETACILGHSHAVGLQITLDGGPDYIAELGMTAETMLTYDAFLLPDGSIGSLRSGLQARAYEQIYVLLGINDILSGRALPAFSQEMEALLDCIAEDQPEANVCLLSIAPLGKALGYPCGTIEAWNATLRSIATERSLDYLDIGTALTDDSGYLNPAYDRGDGLHFNEAGNLAILDLLLSHMEERA